MDSMERDHVHSVYSQIAPHFSDTRYKPWPRVEEFLRSQPPGSLIADVGEFSAQQIPRPHLILF